MEPITRRQALLLGACGAAGVVVGGLGLSSTGLPWTSPDATPSGPLAEPSSLRSRGGVLRTELVAAEHENEIAGRRALVLGYNGSVPASTWRVRPGDRIEVRLENRLREPTNLHTHGLHVSPTGNGDNPLISLAPGEVFDYRFDLPPDHPSGVFWYHPHHHDLVAGQLATTLGPLHASGAGPPAIQVLVGGADRPQRLQLGLGHHTCLSIAR